MPSPAPPTRRPGSIGSSPPSPPRPATRDPRPATRESNRNGWRKWEAFARTVGAATLPAAPDDVTAFVEHLAGAKPSTIYATLAAVSAAHRLAGAPSPTASAKHGTSPEHVAGTEG